jgi:hypothetical protein
VEPHTRVFCVRAIRCLWGDRGRVIAHTEIYLSIRRWNFYISDHPELSVCLSVHTFRVRYHKRWRWDGSAADTDGERFSERRVERVAGLGTRLPVPIASPASYVPTLHTRVFLPFALCQKWTQVVSRPHPIYVTFVSRTLSRDETSLQPAQPVCSADDGCLVVSCHFINHRRPLRGARRPHGGE